MFAENEVYLGEKSCEKAAMGSQGRSGSGAATLCSSTETGLTCYTLAPEFSPTALQFGRRPIVSTRERKNET